MLMAQEEFAKLLFFSIKSSIVSIALITKIKACQMK